MADSGGRPVALVTGGSGGIGRATACWLAARGFDIAVNYAANHEAAADTARRSADQGADTTVVRADVSDDAECVNLVKHCADRWGRLDALVNNAGITRFASSTDLDQLCADDFSRIGAVNVTGAYQMTRAALPLLRESPVASIVNLSSHSGISGIGSSIAYAASKGALNTLTLSLARALAPQVRVNAVCPGFVDTAWHEKSGILVGDRLERFRQKMKDTSPLKRITSADDVAEAVGFFITGGRAVTGVLLVVDGGTHLTVGSPL